MMHILLGLDLFEGFKMRLIVSCEMFVTHMCTAVHAMKNDSVLGFEA